MKKTISLLLAVLMLAAVLTACGNKTTTSAPASTPAAAAPEAETADPAKLNLSGRHWVIGGQPRNTSLYLYYAEELGLFEEAGLDVEIVSLANGPALNESLNAGELDAAANGMAAVYILPTGNYYYVGDANMNYGGQAMYARTDSEIVKAGKYKDTNLYGSPETAKGATILGLAAAPQQYIAYAWAEALGLNDDDITFVAMDHAQAYQAFMAGEGDCVGSTQPYSNEMDVDPNYTLIADFKDLAGGPLLDSIVFNKELADQYPDDVVAILNCMYTSMNELQNNPDKRAAFAKNLYETLGGTTTTDENIQSEIANVNFWTWDKLANPDFPFGNTMTVIGDFFIKMGLIEEGSETAIQESLNHSFVERLLEYRAANGL